MAKCALCKEKVQQTFLQKPLGTYQRDEKGKKHLICQKCQKGNSTAEIKEKL